MGDKKNFSSDVIIIEASNKIYFSILTLKKIEFLIQFYRYLIFIVYDVSKRTKQLVLEMG